MPANRVTSSMSSSSLKRKASYILAGDCRGTMLCFLHSSSVPKGSLLASVLPPGKASNLPWQDCVVATLLTESCSEDQNCQDRHDRGMYLGIVHKLRQTGGPMRVWPTYRCGALGCIHMRCPIRDCSCDLKQLRGCTV